MHGSLLGKSGPCSFKYHGFRMFRELKMQDLTPDKKLNFSFVLPFLIDGPDPLPPKNIVEGLECFCFSLVRLLSATLFGEGGEGQVSQQQNCS